MLCATASLWEPTAYVPIDEHAVASKHVVSTGKHQHSAVTPSSLQRNRLGV